MKCDEDRIEEEFSMTVGGFAQGPQDEIDALRAFAQAVMDTWPGGDLDGGTLQEIAEKYGMLKPEIRHKPCREGCCDENADAQELVFGVTCYRKTPLLTGSKVE